MHALVYTYAVLIVAGKRGVGQDINIVCILKKNCLAYFEHICPSECEYNYKSIQFTETGPFSPVLGDPRALPCLQTSASRVQSQQRPALNRGRVSSCTSGLRGSWGGPGQRGYPGRALTLQSCMLFARTAVECGYIAFDEGGLTTLPTAHCGHTCIL